MVIDFLLILVGFFVGVAVVCGVDAVRLAKEEKQEKAEAVELAKLDALKSIAGALKAIAEVNIKKGKKKWK